MSARLTIAIEPGFIGPRRAVVLHAEQDDGSPFRWTLNLGEARELALELLRAADVADGSVVMAEQKTNAAAVTAAP